MGWRVSKIQGPSIGKRKIKISGEPHRLVVLRVLARDHLGRPSRVEVLYDDSTTQVEAGATFHTAYIHNSATETRGGKPS